MVDADDKLLPYPTGGMVNLVELQDLVHRLFHIVNNFEETKVFARNKAELEEMQGKKFHPCFPISSIRPVKQNNRYHARFASLHECECLEGFIHRAEAARKKGKGVCLLHEVEFACEKV